MYEKELPRSRFEEEHHNNYESSLSPHTGAARAISPLPADPDDRRKMQRQLKREESQWLERVRARNHQGPLLSSPTLDFTCTSYSIAKQGKWYRHKI